MVSDLDVLTLLDRVHAAEREYYRLYFSRLMPDGSQDDRSVLERARQETRRLEDEFYDVFQASHYGKITLF